MAFQLLAEVLAGVEGVETGGEVALFVAKPAAPEGLQGLQLQVLVLNLTPLDQDLLLQLLVDKDVRRLMLQRRLQRLFELVFGAGAGGSVWPVEFGRKFAAQSRPQNADDDIAGRRLLDLRLKARVRRIVAVWPRHPVEFESTGKLGVQLLEDRNDPASLVIDIGWRRDEDGEFGFSAGCRGSGHAWASVSSFAIGAYAYLRPSQTPQRGPDVDIDRRGGAVVLSGKDQSGKSREVSVAEIRAYRPSDLDDL